MLGYILAVLVGTGSVGLYVAAFFVPEIHRKQDFIWSSVGLFYSLALWIYAREMSGGLLLGQAASVALLGWMAWQTFSLRRQLLSVEQQPSVPTVDLNKNLNNESQPPSSPPRQSTPLSDRPAVKSPTRTKPAAPVAAPTQAAANRPPERVPAKPAVPVSDQSIATDEAWIRLEVKPSSDNSTLVPEITRSAPTAKDRPEPLSPKVSPPANSQLTPPASTPVPSPPANSPPQTVVAPQSQITQPAQSLPANPPPARQERVFAKIPTTSASSALASRSVANINSPPALPAIAEQSPAPAPITTTKPLGEAAQSPANPPQPTTTSAAIDLQPSPFAPEEPALESLIAELESES